MIGYVTVGTNDLDRARAYYDELFGSIGGKRLMQLEDQRGFTLYGVSMNRPGIVVIRPFDGRAADQWLMDSARLNALGWQPKISLEEGLRRAYADFLEHSLQSKDS